MQILRNEVRTGLLVILTLGLVVSVVLYLSSPGLFRPQKMFLVYFDNADFNRGSRRTASREK
jgi:ABC-type transporter Mla subunit MlaD